MSNNKIPEISIVMSVYNGGSYLKGAIDSILAQTFTDFEFVIIDDGSTDESAKIIRSYSDPRIRFLEQENRGLVASLNRGIKLSNAVYIARQDADDLSGPTRLEKQLGYLERNPEVLIVGSSIRVIDVSGKELHDHRVLLNDTELRQELLVRSSFAHGSVVFRKDEALKAGLYNQAFWPAEDYEFWLRLSKYGQLGNIDEPLYKYRENSAGISMKNHVLQQEKVLQIQGKAWEYRNDLISRRKIRLGKYRKLDHGQMRIQRILANTQAINRKALAKKNPLFAAKNSALLLLSPTAHRKLAGKLKRKVRG